MPTHVNEDEILRATAVVMHDVLTSELHYAEETIPTAPPEVFEAQMGGISGAACRLSIKPTQLVWHPIRCSAEFSATPLNTITLDDLDDMDDTERAVLSIGLVSGSCFALDFGDGHAKRLQMQRQHESCYRRRRTSSLK